MNEHLTPFEPKTSIEEYLKDDFYKEIYAEISNDSSDELLEPLEYLNLLAQHIELSGQVEVFDVIKHLQALNLKDYQLYLLYTHLISYQNHINQAISGITPQTTSTYINILSQYASKLKEKIESEKKSSAAIKLKVSSKKGSKTDLIRILDAIYELRLIMNQDNTLPSKIEFFNAIGGLLGEDFSNYHSNLSQAYKNQALETNLTIFNKMNEYAKKKQYDGKK